MHNGWVGAMFGAWRIWQVTAGFVPTAAMAWVGNASPRVKSSPGPRTRRAGFFDIGIAHDMGCAAATALA
jgi:hypothetical protein